MEMHVTREHIARAKTLVERVTIRRFDPVAARCRQRSDDIRVMEKVPTSSHTGWKKAVRDKAHVRVAESQVVRQLRPEIEKPAQLVATTFRVLDPLPEVHQATAFAI